MNQSQNPRRLAFITLVCLVLAGYVTADGQEGPPALVAQATEAGPDPVQDQVETKKTFAEIVAQIRKNEGKINRLFSTIPIGFPEQQTAHMNEIEQLKAENGALKGQMESAALTAYKTNAGADRRAARIVFSILSDKIDVVTRDGFFDPQGALEIADMMMKAGSENGETQGQIPATDIAYQAFRASFAIEDFDQADKMLKTIENSGISIRPSIREQMEKTRELWNRELKIRRLESSTDDLPRVKLETSAGDIVVELFENHAPQTVANFISLVEKHLYDDLTFFHVIPGEFAKTGCPLDNGSGDPGYRIPSEYDREQIRHHFSGTLSMVNSGRDTGGSQFRILHQPNGQFDGNSTAFGRVIEGMDVVYHLNRINPKKKKLDAVEPSTIQKATVIRKRDHEYPFSRIAKKPIDSTGESDLPSSLDQAKKSNPGG